MIGSELSKKLGRPLREVPVGFKWFVEGPDTDGSLLPSDERGEERCAGAQFSVRRDEVGTVWDHR
jgi:phosphoglucomutase